MNCVKTGRAASETTLKLGGKPATSRNLSTYCVKVSLNASTLTSRPGVASHSRRRGTVFRVKLACLLPQSRQASSDASLSDGSLNHTALHDLHISSGGKMVPFGGYSMPVQYSDLSVGESHKWTREKASLFDVGHM